MSIDIEGGEGLLPSTFNVMWGDHPLQGQRNKG